MESVVEAPRAPERTFDQRMAALRRANVTRTHRKQVKRDLAAGRKRFTDLFDDELCATMKVFDALLAVPKVGRVKANRMLKGCGISPSKTIGGLSERQRRELLCFVGGRG